MSHFGVEFAPLLKIQQNDWSEAKQLLEPLAEQGNADAIFWLAEITYRGSVFSGSDGAQLFKESAKLGNPYAAIRLSPKYNSYECKMRMRFDCDESWGDLGIELLETRAKSGDIRAEYALYFYTRFDDTDVEDFNHFLKVVKRSAENNYYRPLIHLTSIYLRRENLSPFDSSNNPLSIGDKEELLKLLSYAANNNSMQAADMINSSFKDTPNASDIVIDSVRRNLPVIDNINFRYLIFDYFIQLGSEQRESLLEGYAYAAYFDRKNDEDNTGLYEYMIQDSRVRSLSAKDKEQSLAVYGKEIQLDKPAIYIDEISGAEDIIFY